MAEDQTDSEAIVTKVPLKGSEEARTTLERLQKKGILPVRETPEPPKVQTPPVVPEALPDEVYDPNKKMFPQDPEAKAKILEYYKGSNSVSPGQKRELTEEARKLNTMAMAGEAPETEQAQVTTPVSETRTPEVAPVETPPATYQPQVEAKGGSAFLKKALKENEPQESTRTVGASAYRVPSETEFLPPSQRSFQKSPPAQPTSVSRPPMAEQTLREQVKSTPREEPKPSFWTSLVNRIRGRA